MGVFSNIFFYLFFFFLQKIVFIPFMTRLLAFDKINGFIGTTAAT